MPAELLAQLERATGDSHFVVVAFVDIRGFSSFARIAESVEAAAYLKRFYRNVLADHFQGADYCKLTGDGMMLVFQHAEDDLKRTACAVLQSALSLIDAYPTMFVHDPLITFEVPNRLGIGIARAAATRLISGDDTLDYSGRPLNLAARLMDLARPEGIVLDSSVWPSVEGTEEAKVFTEAAVYVKGIHETVPRQVYLNPAWTQLPPDALRPIGEFVWRTESTLDITLRQLMEGTESLRYFRLTYPPAFPDDVRVEVEIPEKMRNGQKHPSEKLTKDLAATYVNGPLGPVIRYSKSDLIAIIEDVVKPSWEFRILCHYQVNKSDLGDGSQQD